jgi:predicted transcriptional regulator
MVKNNVHKSAETDLYNAVVLTSVDIVGTMVKEHRAEINQIPSLLDTLVKAFTKSAAVSGITIPHAEAPTAPVVVPEAEVKAGVARKRDLSGPAHEAMLARMAKARAAKGNKISSPVETIEQATPEPVAEVVSEAREEAEAPRRGRGRPRIIRAEEPKPEPLAHAEADDDQKALDKKFLRRNPAKCTVKQSLKDIGDGKMTCLIDGKRVSFLATHLKRNYGMTFADYSRIYGLPADYPTTPPKFKAGKKEDAKRLGLGTKQMRLAHKEKIAGATDDSVVEIATHESVVENTGNETTAETPVVVARPSGRARRTTVVDVAAVANAA